MKKFIKIIPFIYTIISIPVMLYMYLTNHPMSSIVQNINLVNNQDKILEVLGGLFIIENKLLEVKFLLEKLPGYHDFIMKLTEPYK